MDDWKSFRHDWMNVASVPTKSGPGSLPDARELAVRQRESKRFHVDNLLILLITLLVVGWFLFFYTQYGSPLARTGRWLMVGSLAVRILIEGWSVWRLSRIDLSDSSRRFVDSVASFRRMRSRLHGPVTVGIVTLYSLGFYLLLPETSEVMGTGWALLFGGSYAVGATIIILLVRRGIRREQRSIAEWAELAEELRGLS